MSLSTKFYEDNNFLDTMAKPKQKFEFNFQNDISEQLEQISKHQ